MSPTSYRAAPPRGDVVTLPEPCPPVNRLAEIASARPAPRSDASDADRLPRLEPPAARERQQHAPGAPRGQQPVGLASEDPEELRLQRRARDGNRTRAVRREALDQVLGDDAAHPHGEAERDRRKRDAQDEPRGVIREAISQVP